MSRQYRKLCDQFKRISHYLCKPDRRTLQPYKFDATCRQRTDYTAHGTVRTANKEKYHCSQPLFVRELNVFAFNQRTKDRSQIRVRRQDASCNCVDHLVCVRNGLTAKETMHESTLPRASAAPIGKRRSSAWDLNQLSYLQLKFVHCEPNGYHFYFTVNVN